MLRKALQNYYNNPSSFSTNIGVIQEYCITNNKDSVDTFIFIHRINQVSQSKGINLIGELVEFIRKKYLEENNVTLLQTAQGEILILNNK